MPELPEVQTTVNGINRYVRGLKIVDVWTDYVSTNNLPPTTYNQTHIKNSKFFRKFKKEVIGARILRAERRAKNILIHLSNRKVILIHMKMTGHVLYGKYKFIKNKWVPTGAGALRDDPFNRFVHFVINLSDRNHLVLSDMRKFAKITIFDKTELSKEFSQTGPEPLSKKFTPAILRERLLKRPKGKIKQILMDQNIVAGIGNIYSDEILWASAIHPMSIVGELNERQFRALWKFSNEILKKGIKFGGDSMSDYRDISGGKGKFQLEHQAYRRTGFPCRKRSCAGKIERMVIGGRSSHYCNRHQKLYA